MKITIDTKEDTHEEIRKVIRMLQQLVGESSYTNRNLFGETQHSLQESQESTNVFASLFGNQIDESQNKETEDKEEDKSEDIPEVIPY